MINLAALHRVRKHPAFAAYFDFVLPIFWPVVFWYLLRVADSVDARRCGEVLVFVHWWGGIEITYYGDPAPSPSAYRPLTPMRKAWDDPAWETSVPVFLGAEASAVIFPCFSGGSGRPRSGLTKGACALSPHADTS
ncbi:MAG: hypothetical protein C0456_12170 [Hyphomonas sp.]|uniref:hypothetical protein n=1 Tax=Hyphomonas sp. TaxID=87 RepID=UPI001DE97218|nr:hypothetical protein [Hyphomonas sp.]MBA4227378.1 hypothetical protein [Hyphomonas sp.]